MSIYRHVIDGVIVNRLVVADTKDAQPEWLEDEVYELETEEYPPGIGWIKNAEGVFEPPPQEEPA